jgi:hypothetical protein
LNEKQIPQIVGNNRNQKKNGTVGVNHSAPKAGALPGCATPRHYERNMNDNDDTNDNGDTVTTTLRKQRLFRL